jgi:hypothetical protein
VYVTRPTYIWIYLHYLRLVSAAGRDLKVIINGAIHANVLNPGSLYTLGVLAATGSNSNNRPPMLKTRLIDNGEMTVSVAEDQHGLLIAKRRLEYHRDEEVRS